MSSNMVYPDMAVEETPSSPVFDWIMGDNDEFLASLAAVEDDGFAATGTANHDPYQSMHHSQSAAPPLQLPHAVSDFPDIHHAAAESIDAGATAATQDIGPQSPSHVWLGDIDPNLWAGLPPPPSQHQQHQQHHPTPLSSPCTPFLDALRSPTLETTAAFPLAALGPVAGNVPTVAAAAATATANSVSRRSLPRRKSRLNLSGASSRRESSVEGASSSARTGRSRLRRPTSTSSLNSIDTATSVHSADSNASNVSRYNLSRSSSRRRSRNNSRSAAGGGGGAGGGTGVGTTGASIATKARRPFYCTFCCDTFKSKYDWARHEKSLHLSLERWICAPHGGTVVSPATGRSQCAYCNVLDPTPEHLDDAHHHRDCQQEASNTASGDGDGDGDGGKAVGQPAAVFSRKDHLVQHLRHVHHIKVLPVIDDWKVDAPPVASRCGFCDARMVTWHGRVEHLAAHFKSGKTMADWVGDHGFEPAIAAQVGNALPPYLIASESKSPVPFSATDSGTRQHLDQVQQAHRERLIREQQQQEQQQQQTQQQQQQLQYEQQTSGASPVGTVSHNSADGGSKRQHMALPPPPPAASSSSSSSDRETIVQVLTRGLGRFARHQMSLGVVPTDQMFQDESRRLVYGSDDSWNQTIADNAEWLRDFRARNVDSGG